MLMELSGHRNAQTQQLLTDASVLTAAEQQMQRTENGIAALQTKLAAQKNSLGKLLTTQKATLASLTVPQQQTVATNTIGAGGTTTATYTGPTTTQADKAVAFAYAQLGKPYQWGATGPSSFDCSGLAQAAGSNCIGPRAPALDGPSSWPKPLSTSPMAARTVQGMPYSAPAFLKSAR